MQYPKCSGNSSVDPHHVDLMKLADLAGLSVKPQILRLVLCGLRNVCFVFRLLTYISSVRKFNFLYVIFEIWITVADEIPKVTTCQDHASVCKGGKYQRILTYQTFKPNTKIRQTLPVQLYIIYYF